MRDSTGNFNATVLQAAAAIPRLLDGLFQPNTYSARLNQGFNSIENR